MAQTLSQRSWEWIKNRGEFGSKDLSRDMDITLKQAQMIISHLTTLGAITSLRRGYNGAVYARVEGVEPHLPGKNATSPRKVCIRQRVWQAMRFYQTFTIADIMAAAECSKSSVERYISDLRRYKYVTAVRRQNVRTSMAKRRGHQNRYLLLVNTGHKYPVMSAKGLRDQNRNELVPLPAEKIEKEIEKCTG